ncbi:hypothetical protein L226DRAFT_302729 [Lentinus tigrinus ALCF2SS1-7]|uniref:Uncharacterized protein n=1 Tax=Lentinus tigrinus ALCF2SS1-6 TaxID=1328759 RepID=A0A5C2S2A8_9APHY|nr:hypothetical protein L227DRAFT_227527 [Lentinus tigrinus ALCF2SS1-6]RPD78822.1 hypothetical protein L226DRAFT_302729 [Lentinus tigrinus ALCF2SS1-7]
MTRCVGVRPGSLVGICLVRRTCIWLFHVCLCMLSMSLIVVSANVNASDSVTVSSLLVSATRNPASAARSQPWLLSGSEEPPHVLPSEGARSDLDFCLPHTSKLAHGPIRTCSLPRACLPSPFVCCRVSSLWLSPPYLHSHSVIQLSYTHAILQCLSWCHLLYRTLAIAAYTPRCNPPRHHNVKNPTSTAHADALINPSSSSLSTTLYPGALHIPRNRTCIATTTLPSHSIPCSYLFCVACPYRQYSLANIHPFFCCR